MANMSGGMQFWPNELFSRQPQLLGAKFELRTQLAWELLCHNSSVIAGTPEGEDTAGRSKLRLQEPYELVQRVFAIADEFVDFAVNRHEIQMPMSAEALAAGVGEHQRQQDAVQWRARPKVGDALNETAGRG